MTEPTSNQNSETVTNTPESNEQAKTCKSHQSCKGRSKKKWVIGGIIALVIAGFAISSSRHHGHHGGHRYNDAMTVSQIEEGADKFAERLAKRVDASDEQTEKLKQIAQAASKDIAPVRTQMKDTREQLVKLLEAPTVDRVALEQLRSTQIQQMDEVSKRMAQSLADASDVLTPEQRAKLAERWQN